MIAVLYRFWLYLGAVLFAFIWLIDSFDHSFQPDAPTGRRHYLNKIDESIDNAVYEIRTGKSNWMPARHSTVCISDMTYVLAVEVRSGRQMLALQSMWKVGRPPSLRP
jgi:hypothetical protein